MTQSRHQAQEVRCPIWFLSLPSLRVVTTKIPHLQQRYSFKRYINGLANYPVYKLYNSISLTRSVAERNDRKRVLYLYSVSGLSHPDPRYSESIRPRLPYGSISSPVTLV